MMNDSSTQNPLGSRAKAETLYDKLNNLAAEISEGIINLSGASRDEMQKELSAMKDAAFQERSPEAVYNTQLFRKYADIANQIKDSQRAGAGVDSRSTLIRDLPSFVYESDDGNLLVGWEATRTNIFRIRIVTVMFSLIAFAVMSATPAINEADWAPNDHFLSSCQIVLSGSFNFRSYQLVIAIGVMSFLFNGLICGYYLLPIDSDRLKYIPGCLSLLDFCMDYASAQSYMNQAFLFLKETFTLISLAVDGFLLFLAVIAFIVSLFVLESSVETELAHSGGSIAEYYTLSTVYETYANEDPPCLEKALNPTPFIRGALAMFFFAMLGMLICFLISFRSLREEMGHGFFSGFSAAFGLASASATTATASGAAGGGISADGGRGAGADGSSGEYGMRPLAQSAGDEEEG
mmetsp:Transcript_164/g.217  ORF Transcript_164/g.217 Transcript_164/m.217 type:complete len:407 (+) Transcript_164:116-1336(+)